MASRAFLCIILLGGLHSFVAAPTINRLRNSPSPMLNVLGRRSGWDVQKAFLSDDNVHMDFIGSLLIAPAAEPTSTYTTTTSDDIPDYPFSFPFISNPPTSVESTTTLTVTEEEPITITASASPTTITELITITYYPSTSSSASAPLPSPSPGGTVKAIWVAPKNFTDLDSFQVSRYSGGHKNIKIVTGIPAEASATAAPSDASKMGESPVPWDNASAAMQLFYPANSIDPAQKPQGGADFYAEPLDISDATNVTLEYSVFFPNDFDWVLAGKLPGMYGGHTGCSGGNAALDCFSTRMMWRQDGEGELYLYAPKDKQTKELCDDPKSSCDEAYGLSIGRGSFKWAAGSWTNIRQTISLNTPGEQDGSFTLDVNGQRKIDRNDVFYREDLSSRKNHAKTTHASSKTTSKKHHENPTPTSTTLTPTSTDDGDILGPLLGGIGGILGGLWRNGGAVDDQMPTATGNAEPSFQSTVSSARQPTSSSKPPTVTPREEDTSAGTEAVNETQVKLIGIFFSTFFGGHEEKYATPRDQYVWFKDFALSYNL